MPGLGDLSGNYVGAAVCEETYPTNNPPVPYGPSNANADPSLLVEEGFKPIRGQLTEGRFLTFEMNGSALTASSVGSLLSWEQASARHRDKAQRWVVHQVGSNDYTQNSNEFLISSAVDGRYISGAPSLTLIKSKASAGTFTFNDLGNGKGYAVSAGNSGVFHPSANQGWSIFSVTYHS